MRAYLTTEGPIINEGMLDVSAPPYNAVGDVKVVTDGSMAAGSGSLSSPTAGFTAADINKLVSVAGAKSLIRTGNTHSNTTVDGLTNLDGLFVGMSVSGSGIPAGTKISAIASASSITLTAAATSTLTGTSLTFGNHLSGTITGYTNPTTVTVSVTADLAVSGATVTWGTDNRAAFVSAISDAATTKQTVFAPEGTYGMNLHPSGASSPLPSFDGLRIKGASRDGTVLRIFPDGVNDDWYVFSHTGNQSIDVRDLSIIGPDQVTGGANGGFAMCFHHTGTGGLIRLANVKVTQFNYIVHLHPTAATTVSLDASDCDFQGWANYRSPCDGIGAFDVGPNGSPGPKYVKVRDSRFQYFGQLFTPEYHPFYVFTSWQLEVDRCRFESAFGNGVIVSCYDEAPQVIAANAADHMRVRDCYFAANLANGTNVPGCITTNHQARSHILNNWFRVGGYNINASGPTLIEGNELRGQISAQVSGSGRISDNSFVTEENWCVDITVPGAWEINDNRFNSGNAGTTNLLSFIRAEAGSAGSILRVTDNIFEGPYLQWGCVHISDAITATVQDNRFAFTTGGGAGVLCDTLGGGSAATRVGVHNNNFSQTSGTNVKLTVAPVTFTAGGNFGSANYVTENGGTNTQTPGATATVTIPHGLGNTNATITPSRFNVNPANANARGAPAFFVTADATNITLTFASNLTAATSYAWQWAAVK